MASVIKAGQEEKANRIKAKEKTESSNMQRPCSMYFQSFDDFANGPSAEDFFHFLVDSPEEETSNGSLRSEFPEEKLYKQVDGQ